MLHLGLNNNHVVEKHSLELKVYQCDGNTLVCEASATVQINPCPD